MLLFCIKNIKKKVLFLILCSFLLAGCHNIPKKAWNKIDTPKLTLDLRAGDIIIKEREFNLLGIFGHSGIMKTERIVVDYPKFGEKISVLNIENWLEEERNFIILRYKDMNEEFQKRLIAKLDYYIYINRKYGISFDKRESEYFYCSQFIWYLYYETALELGIELDLDSNKGIFILPYDFIYSRELYIVNSLE